MFQRSEKIAYPLTFRIEELTVNFDFRLWP